MSNSITKNSEVLTSLKSNSATHVEKLEQTIKITNRKADIYDLQALAKEMTTLTPLNTFYQLQEWTQTLASKTEIIKIDKELTNIRLLISDCPTFEQMLNELTKVVVDLKSEISKEKNLLSARINEIKEMNIDNDGKIELTKNKIQQNNEILSKKINEIFEFVLEKPWKAEVDELNEKIDAKAESQEIIDLRSVIEPKLDEFLAKSTLISNDLNNYTSVLARFDEVILTKASKEDVKSIQKLMNNIVLQNAMDPIITEVYSRIKIIEEAQSLQLKTLEDTKKEVVIRRKKFF